MEFSDWRAYQQSTAEVFRRLGCNAQVEYKAAGVRGNHDIDVYATFHRSGILCTWVVECKLWKTKVTKEKVMALRSIVEDLGADRGIIVSEVGFQPGAHDAARGTNITLVTSIEEFERTALAASTEISLALDSSESGLPIYRFPHRSGPSDIVAYGELLVTANWAGGSISIVDPSRKSILRTIDLDKYEATSPKTGLREVRSHPPGNIAIADGRLFVGQVFSESILVIDLATHSIVKRIAVPGGGEGQLSASADERTVFFASNKVSQFFAIDCATYAYTSVPFPYRGRGCMSLLKHPSRPLLYIGVSRGGNIDGKYYPHASSYLAVYDLHSAKYIAETHLGEVIDGHVDDASPACITFDPRYGRLYVGMFQSMRGICVVDATTNHLVSEIRFEPNGDKPVFRWVDPLSQAIAEDYVLSVNRNNNELAFLDRQSLKLLRTVDLGLGPNGARSVAVWKGYAVVTYPTRNGLIFVPIN